MNILVLHNVEDLRKTRRSMLDYMFAFQRYQPDHTYLYHRISDPPSLEIQTMGWDAVILVSTALGICTFRPRELFFEALAKWSFLADPSIIKVAFPQDDANHSGVMDDWFSDWGVQYVFSVRPEHKDTLYPKSSKTAEFRHCFAGYIDDLTLPAVEKFSKPWVQRKRLLGQRVTMYPYRGGRQGRLKGLIALEFKSAAERKKIAVDISVDPKETFFGDAWFQFLGDCKYVLASEGGLSLLDPYGEIQDRINDYLRINPGASFEEVEAACFPGLDGVHVFEGFSPRILEAAVLRGSQVLVEGRYRGILEAGKHYLALKADCSNLDEVIDSLKDEQAAQSRVAACEDALVRNPRFRYSTLANEVIKTIAENGPTRSRGGRSVSSGLARRGYTRIVTEREAAIGFKGAALVDRVSNIVESQAASLVFEGGPHSGHISRISGDSAALRVLAMQVSTLSDAASDRGAIGLAFAGMAKSLEHLASLSEIISDFAHATSADDLSQNDLSAVAATLRNVREGVGAIEAWLLTATPDAAGLLKLADVNAPQAEAVAALVGPELEAGKDRLSDEGAADIAKVAAKFRQQGRAASAMSALSYDIPADASWLLDVVLPASAKTGGWYPDDIERLKQAKIVLKALLAGGDRSRLLTAIAGLDDADVGIASRLAPVSGRAFTPLDLKLLGHVDRILIRAASGSQELAYLESVQEAGDNVRRVFDAINTRGDVAALVGALGRDILERPSNASPRWPEEQVRRFQLLTAVVGTFGSSDGRERAVDVMTRAPVVLTDIVNELSYAGMSEGQSGEWEQNRQLTYETAVLIGRSPRLRAIIRAIVSMGSKGRRS